MKTDRLDLSSHRLGTTGHHSTSKRVYRCRIFKRQIRNRTFGMRQPTISIEFSTAPFEIAPIWCVIALIWSNISLFWCVIAPIHCVIAPFRSNFHRFGALSHPFTASSHWFVRISTDLVRHRIKSLRRRTVLVKSRIAWVKDRTENMKQRTNRHAISYISKWFSRNWPVKFEDWIKKNSLLPVQAVRCFYFSFLSSELDCLKSLDSSWTMVLIPGTFILSAILAFI